MSFDLPYSQDPKEKLKEDIRNGVILVNTISYPFRLIDKGIQKACQTTEMSNKVCQAVGQGVNSALNAAKSVVPQCVKEKTGGLGQAMRQTLESQGFSKSEVSYFMDSTKIVGLAAATAGAGAIAGRTIQGMRTASKVNMVSSKTVTAPIKNIPKAANKNSPHLPGSHVEHQIKTPLANFTFSTTKRADGSMTAFIDGLKGLQTTGATYWAMKVIKDVAKKEGATSLNLQWMKGNSKLFNMFKKPNPRMQYLGKAPHPTPFNSTFYRELGPGSEGFLFHVFNVKNFKNAGLGLSFFGLAQSSAQAFTEGVQQNSLVDSYNSSNSDAPMSEGGASGGEIGGVGHQVEFIQGLFQTADGIEHHEHRFFIPAIEGKPPFTQELLQQLIREMALGIYYYDTVPFFSLHFNADHHLYPVIHHVYQNTAVGRVTSLLDYYMKGFLNGGFFHEETIHQWIKSGYNEAVLKDQCIDLHEYCQTHLDSSVEYLSVHELLHYFESENKDPEEPALFSDYSGFRSSFRIIAKQNSIQHWDNLFLLDGDFDVYSTIEPDAVYAEELKRYRALHGKDPQGYTRLEKAYAAMRQQIKNLMPRLFKELFDQLKVINFLAYYFKTLKKAGKAPCLDPKEANHTLSSPTLFPALPIKKFHSCHVNINLETLFNMVPSEQKTTIQQFLERQYQPDGTIPDHIIDSFLPTFKQYLKSASPLPLSDKELALKKYRRYLTDIIHAIGKNVKESLSVYPPELILERKQKAEAQAILLSQKKESLIEGKKRVAESRQLIIDIQSVINQYNQDKLKLQAEVAKIPPAQLNHAAVQSAYQEIDQEISKRQAIIAEISQSCAEDDLKIINFEVSINKHEDELTKFENATANIEKIVNNPTGHCSENLHLDLSLNVSLVQLFSEQSQNEQNKTKRIVGGCGLNMDAIKAEVNPSGQSLLASAFEPLLISESETWIPQTSKDTPKGVLFKLHFKDNPAVDKQEYGWMAHQMKKENIQLTFEKAALFSTFENENIQGFQQSLGVKQNEEATQGDVLKNTTDCQGVSVAHYAAKASIALFLQELIRKGTDLSVADPLGLTPLHYAAQYGRIENISLLLKCAPHLINQKANNGATALNLAIQHNQKNAVVLLLQSGSTVNHRMNHGMTPLFSAVHHGFEEIALMLLKVPGIDVDSPLECGRTTLAVAVDTEQLNLVKALLAAGANIQKATIDSTTPLHVAAKKGSKEVCALLLSHPGVDINVPLKSGLTPLHLAIQFNLFSVQLLFIQRGASLSTYGWEKVTPFHLAVSQGNSDAVRTMVEAAGKVTLEGGARLIDFPDLYGKTPLNIALNFRFHDIVELLLNGMATQPITEEFIVQLCQSKIDPLFIRNVINTHALRKEQLQKAYYIAAKVGHNQMVSLFERQYEVLPFCDENEWSSIHFAAKYDHFDLIRKQIASGKDLQLKDKEGFTLTGIATRYGSKNVLKILLKALEKNLGGALLEGHLPRKRQLLAQAVESASHECVEIIASYLVHLNIALDQEGRHASHIAAQEGDVEMLELLRTRGANFSMRDKAKQTAFHYAFAFEREDAIDYFLNKKYEFHLPLDLLAFTARKGKPKHVERLLKKGIDPNQSENNQDLPIFDAIRAGRLDTLLVLASYGADLNRLSVNGDSAVSLAAKEGQHKILEYLSLYIKGEATKLPPPISDDGRTKYHKMALKGEVVDFKNKDVWKVDKHGVSILHLYATQDNINSLKLAINSCSQIDCEDDRGCTPLGYALISEKYDAAKCLLEAKANPNHRNKNQVSPFFIAIEQKALIDAMLKHGANPNSHNFNNKTTALHFAVQNDYDYGVQKLIAAGARVNQGDIKGVTPLHTAAKKGRLDLVTTLYTAGASLKAKDHEGLTVIHYAAESGKLSLIDYFESKGVRLDKPAKIVKESLRTNSYKTGLTPLHIAARSGELPLVKKLIEKGNSIDALDESGRGVLFYATFSGNQALIQFVLVTVNSKKEERLKAIQSALFKDSIQELKLFYPGKDGVDDILDEQGMTALHFASQSGARSSVHYLVKRGADINRKTLEGETAFLLSLRTHKLAVAYYFIEKTSLSIKEILKENKTYLHIACESGDKEMAALLIGRGASLKATDSHGYTPLHTAVKKGTYELVHLLLASGANPSHQTLDELIPNDSDSIKKLLKTYREAYHYRLQNQETPLHTCIRLNDKTHFGVIMRRRDIDQKNNKGQTPLHLAAVHKESTFFRILIERGADIEAIDDQGHTILATAVQKNQRLNRTKWLLSMKADGYSIDNKDRTILQLITERTDRKIAKSLFELVYNQLDLSQTSPEIVTAIEENNPTLFFQSINLGHPVKTHAKELMVNAVAQDADKITEILTDWFDEALPYSLNQLYELNAKKHFIKFYNKQSAKNAPIKKAEELIKKEDPEILWNPVQHGIDLTMTDPENKNSLLHIAVKNKCLQISKILLWCGLDPNCKNKLGNTPLHMAAHFQFVELVALLLEKGADPHTSNNAGLTPLTLSLQKTIHPQIVSLFKEKNSDMNSQLAIVLAKGRTESAQNLISIGANLSFADAYRFNQKELFLKNYRECELVNDNFSSVEIMIKEQSLAQILENKINFNMISAENSNSLLHLAAKYNRLEIGQFLIWFGVDCNSKNRLGNTPLHMAAHFQHFEMMEILLKCSAEPLVQNNQGFAALTLALQKPLEESILKRLKALYLQHGVMINPSFNGQSQKELALSKKTQAIINNIQFLEG